MAAPKVLDIGQCDLDHGNIKRLVESIGGEVLRAYTAKEALQIASRDDVKLMLVNRVLDSDGDDGVQLIGELVKRKDDSATVMLVSNYPEYQAKAVELGAAQGFGKSALRDPRVREQLVVALGL